MTLPFPWQAPLGARPQPDGTTEFRVWAPRATRVAVRLGASDHELADEGFGVHAARLPAGPGDRYEIVLDGTAWPDPASRHQPEGLRGPSAVVEPGAFPWTDQGWRGVPLPEVVLYELHVGTFTEEGTFDAVIPHLAGLRALGVTAIELLPVADFPGMRGWGYDGVYLSAAHRAYGGPEGLMRLVNAAHGEGLAVILDVVYNHVGASGQQALEAFGPYFTDRYSTFWGDALNYDDADCDPVREWVVQSAEGWVGDFHLDGLRLDAIHAIYDFSARHVLAELGERVRAARAGALVIAESGLNDPKVMRPVEIGGLGLDGNWADDFHHALRVLLTGEGDGYYAEFGEVGQLAKAFRRPFVHDGTWSASRRRIFGAPAFDRPPEQFVVFDQNHDQVGNRAFGDRLAPKLLRLAAFCTLLSPFTPLLFMGEEYGEPAPFQFFSDHIDVEIADATREGRRREFASFAAFGEDVPDPQDPETFRRSKLTRREVPGLRELYTRLLGLRRELAGEAIAEHDEEARWLVVRRGEHMLACNFAAEARDVPVAAGEVVLATETASLTDRAVRLPRLAGALLR
ncbi:MAG: treZ [Solirubrobacterales bacterium]|nr:treZ [Solirubrobacterales bacterium]